MATLDQLRDALSKPPPPRPLVPPDAKRCQAEKPGNGPFVMGGEIGNPRDGYRVRCRNKPTVIAREREPGADGQRGSMSLCPECQTVFIRQLGTDVASFRPIPVPTPVRKLKRKIKPWSWPPKEAERLKPAVPYDGRYDRAIKIYAKTIVRYGRKVENGFLPAFSVDTVKEARQLLVFACATNLNGDFISRELAKSQTLPNLQAFSDRLKAAYEFMKSKEQPK